MNGHLCRCGTYPRILTAIQQAAAVMAKGGLNDRTHPERNSRAARSSRAAAPWSSASRSPAPASRELGEGRGLPDFDGLPARSTPTGRLLADDRRRQHRDPQPSRSRPARDHDRLPDGRRRRARHGPQPDEYGADDPYVVPGPGGTYGSQAPVPRRRSGPPPSPHARRCSAWPRAVSACRPGASPSARESSPAAARPPTGSCSAGSSSTSACRRATTWRPSAAWLPTRARSQAPGEADRLVQACREAPAAADRHPGEGDRHLHLRPERARGRDVARPRRSSARAGWFGDGGPDPLGRPELDLPLPNVQVVQKGNFLGVVAPEEWTRSRPPPS